MKILLHLYLFAILLLPLGSFVSAQPPNNNCASAIAVGDVEDMPINTVGATTDGPDEPAACYINGNSRIQADIWYCYTATCSGLVTMSLSGSDFCPKLAVYNRCDCPTTGRRPIVCNSDDCIGSNFLWVIFRAVAGNKYLIRVGSPDGSQGAGLLTIHCTPGLSCPLGATVENEPCGADSNGGCDAVPPVFHAIDFGETVCGTAWAQNAFRDTDWYQKILADSSEVNWIVHAEFGPYLGIFDSSCSYDTVVTPYANAETLSVFLPPGTYNFLVMPWQFDGVSCGNDWNRYIARLLPCLKGDVYPRDGLPTSADVVTMLDCIWLPYAYSPEEFAFRCRLCNVDTNCDGILTPSDYVLELNFVFLGEPLPCQ